MSLYHKEVFMPEILNNVAIWKQRRITEFVFSKHLKEHFNNPDDKHNIDKNLLKQAILKLTWMPVSPFEVETNENGELIKLCVRIKYNDTKDVSIVIGFYSNRTLIKTAWLNNIDDKHYTLNTSLYDKTYENTFYEV